MYFGDFIFNFFFLPYDIIFIFNFLYPIQQRRPALHGDALEDGDAGKDNVVERGDAKIWTLKSDWVFFLNNILEGESEILHVKVKVKIKSDNER